MTLVRRAFAVRTMRRLGPFVMRPRLRRSAGTVVTLRCLARRMRRTVTACVLCAAVTLIACSSCFRHSPRAQSGALDQGIDRRRIEFDSAHRRNEAYGRCRGNERETQQRTTINQFSLP